MASSVSNKPTYQTLEVVLDNGEKVRVKRTPQSNLKTLIRLQDELLAAYINANGSVAELLVDDTTVSLLSQYIGLLPLEGKKTADGEPRYLVYEEISENWEQLTRLVFNGSLDEKTRTIESVTPSLVSNLHFLPYETQREVHLHQKRLEEIEKLNKRNREVEITQEQTADKS